MREDIKEKYFRWILRSAGVSTAYADRMRLMHNTPFEVMMERDINRAEDGENLRYRFGAVCGVPDSVIAISLDILPCSVLEMLSALALRAGEQVFGSPYVKEGAQWIFSETMRNLGIFDAPYGRVNDILRRLNLREYGRDGRGGPFYIRFMHLEDANKFNMHESELWYQMMAYINHNDSSFARITGGQTVV